MTSVREILTCLEQFMPIELKENWDNVGLLVGSREKEVERVYVALDATDDAIAEAAARKADMLLTHHPMIFKGLKKVTDQDFIGRRVIALIRHDIACYAMHTNFDIAGMAELAAERERLEAERQESQKMMAELLQLKKELTGKDGSDPSEPPTV